MNLEEFIKANSDSFDDLEPRSGHYNRFKWKIYRQREMYQILKIAAIFLVAMISTGILYTGYINQDSKYTESLSPELRQTLYYYNALSEEKIKEIKAMDGFDKSTKEMLEREVRHEDSELKKIFKDLEKFPEDERVKSAFIEYHRSKTEFLDYIISQVRELNNNVL